MMSNRDVTVDAIIILVNARSACRQAHADYEERSANWIHLGGERPADLGHRSDYLEAWRAVSNALDYLERHP